MRKILEQENTYNLLNVGAGKREASEATPTLMFCIIIRNV